MNKSEANAQAMSEGCELSQNPMVRVSTVQELHNAIVTY